ncbi:MAG TPA: type IV secretory system conjugative DNA transfer family protein [Solirubrobacteraceae bacterium]|jgi:type IV secretion system protein VirD4|nr:type IV secretory system conjugative DNA transfer family protein [Solirubrobacteraceae bacterium]HXB16027.1 type IV secretory system conjugative DNA transfer family protein [Solirubrobacteraceae bacterium]
MPEILRFDLDRSATEPPWLNGLVLGWLQIGRRSSLVVASHEDSVAILGPPRMGKTSGVLIPQAMTWPGSLISASTKTDVLRSAKARRYEVARQYGEGDVYVYAPADPDEWIGGVRNIRWSPTDGCESSNVCEIRVQNMLGPEKPHEDPFFRQQAAVVMRAFFHAEALSHCGLERMKRWIDAMDVAEAMAILERNASSSHAAAGYASSLSGVDRQTAGTRSSTFATVSEKLAAIVGNATVLANASHGAFDVDRFLLTGSTIFVVSPEDTQRVVAPLVAGLVEAIVSRAYALARDQADGRLNPPLALLLDEVGAIAPLPSLPAIMAQGAGQGVLCVWAAQSITQLRARWGEDWTNAIWGSSTQKLVFGNLPDAELLERISVGFGEHNVRHRESQGGLADLLNIFAGSGGPQSTVMRERVLTVDKLYRQSPGTACLLAMTSNGPDFCFLATPPAGITPPFSYAEQRQVEVPVGRPESVADQAFNAMPIEEQRRFREEEAALQARISQVEALPPEDRLKAISADPEFAREVRASRRMPSGEDAEQLRIELIRQFAQKRVAKFTLVAVASLAERRTEMPRPQSDRYRLPPEVPDR